MPGCVHFEYTHSLSHVAYSIRHLVCNVALLLAISHIIIQRRAAAAAVLYVIYTTQAAVF